MKKYQTPELNIVSAQDIMAQSDVLVDVGGCFSEINSDDVVSVK